MDANQTPMDAILEVFGAKNTKHLELHTKEWRSSGVHFFAL